MREASATGSPVSALNPMTSVRGPRALATAPRTSGARTRRRVISSPASFFLSFELLGSALRQSETAAAITSASASGSEASTASRSSRAVSMGTTRTPPGAGMAVGPVMSVTSAPASRAASATA